ncbi:MAG: hypothetical protein JXR31_14430 [Prolixibacteraceae bacterium]|nr:hypothetical protein [Prolixibacteraceae bacterium]
MRGKEIFFREKRDIGKIISDSFQFIKNEFRPLFGIILIYVIPFFILFAFLQINAQQRLLESGFLNDPEIFMNNPLPFYKKVFVTVLFNVFAQCLYTAVIYSYIEVYVKKGKGNFSTGDVTSELFNNSLIALGAGAMITVIVFFGLIFCIIPGIYFANTLSLVIMIAVFEKKGISMALKRSWNLVNAQWWNTFLLNIIAFLIIMAVGFVFSIPTFIAGLTNSLMGLGQPESFEYPQWYWYLTGIDSVVSSLLYIIPYTFMAFQYFNLDERFNEFRNPPIQL